jgi:hypothetical protein
VRILSSKRIRWCGLGALTLALATSHARAERVSPWGVSPSAALSSAPATWTKDMEAMGATRVRGFHPEWAPHALKAFRDAKLTLSGFLMWSATRPLTLPVAHLDDFRKYVTDTVKRHRAQVTSWEVWNEPPNFTEDTSPVSYAKIVATAHAAAKAVDPQIRIGLAAKSVHIYFLAETIAAGARDKFDFITLHPYETSSLIPQGGERAFLGIVDNVRAMLRERNPARGDVPIWFSEIGVELSTQGRFPVDEAVQADTLIKIYSMGIAQGVEQIDWFDPRDSEGRHLGLLRGNGRARPAFQAYQALRSALGAAPRFLGYLRPSEHSFGFLFAGPTKHVLVSWLGPTGSDEPAPPSDAELLWPRSTGAPHTKGTPNIFAAEPSSALALDWQKRASLDRSGLGSGPTAREVSWHAGVPSESVCVVNAPAALDGPSGKELDLRGGSGAWFAIDPMVIGYKTQPVEIELVARGHGKGKPGFNFKYESNRPVAAANGHGMVGNGHWNFVAGSEPVTFKWRVDDASFVGKYGANLAVDCDSPDNCDFSILSLRLRKLQHE